MRTLPARAVHSLTTRCQHGSLRKRGIRHRAHWERWGSFTRNQKDPRGTRGLFSFLTLPPTPSLPASSACSALVLLPPAPLVRLFPKKQEAGFVFTNSSGTAGPQGHDPGSAETGKCAPRMRCPGSRRPRGERGGGPSGSTRVLIRKSLQNHDVLPHGAHVSLSWKSLEQEFWQKVSRCSCGWISDPR